MVIFGLIKKNEEADLRTKIWKIINLIQANQLFVHSKNITVKYSSGKGIKAKTQVIPEILTLCVLNALVSNSAMILVGGHGGGKKAC